MKNLIVLLFVTLLVGDCVRITSGVFKGQYWHIIAVNKDGTFDIQDRDWIVREVRGSYLTKSEEEHCQDSK